MSEIEKKEQITALEQQILKVITGQDADVIHEAMLLVMHRLLGSFHFGKILFGSNYR